jgi:hypothetical protein
MPTPSLNQVTLIGPLAAEPTVSQEDRLRVVVLKLATRHGGEERIHRVVVRDEFLGRDLDAELRVGACFQAVGELAYDDAGAHVLVSARRGCDLHRVDAGPSLAGSPARTVVPAPVRAPVPQEPAPVRAASPGAGLAGLAGLSGLGAGSDDEPDEDGGPADSPVQRAPDPSPAPRFEPRPAVAPAAPPPGGGPRAPVPRMLPGARPQAPSAPPVPPAHSIAQPKPTEPPLRPGQQGGRRDAFAAQRDDEDIPF